MSKARREDDHTSWVVRALEGGLFRADLAEEDSPALTVLPAQPMAPIMFNMATVTSYDCCSQTQTKGPGCCEIRPDEQIADLRLAAARRQLEDTRLWPIPVE